MTRDQTSSAPGEPSGSDQRTAFLRSYVLTLGVPLGLFVAILYHIKYVGWVLPTTLPSIFAAAGCLVLGALIGYLLGLWEWRDRERRTVARRD